MGSEWQRFLATRSHSLVNSTSLNGKAYLPFCLFIKQVVTLFKCSIQSCDLPTRWQCERAIETCQPTLNPEPAHVDNCFVRIANRFDQIVDAVPLWKFLKQ